MGGRPATNEIPGEAQRMSARLERVTHAASAPALELVEGVSAVFFANGELGANGFSTGLARLKPGAQLPCHKYECGESITILQGQSEIAVEGRTYRLAPYDSIHVPAGLAHGMKSLELSNDLLAHVAFSSATVTRELVTTRFMPRDLRDAVASTEGAEALVRFYRAEEYELSSKALFRDLFAKRLGSKGICGGYGRFAPGASLPCHTHLYDESITIVEGRATCLVAGRHYSLSGCDTALVPKGQPHRFINETDEPMAMVWVYAGDEPERVIVDNAICSGEQK
jgi:quercetin dioxygenase-like cupin family protein